MQNILIDALVYGVAAAAAAFEIMIALLNMGSRGGT